MPSIPRASFVILSLTLAACGDDGGVETDSGSGTDGGSDAGPDASTAPACEAAGADCGRVLDEDGIETWCGVCAAPEVCGAAVPNRCGEETCIAFTCEDVGATCGEVSDGCGATLSCGTCGTEATCTDGLCIEPPTACDGSPANTCGGCAALPYEPGEPCPCTGSTAKCVTEPFSIGLVGCDDGDARGTIATTLAPTDDDVDEFSELTGSIDVLDLADVSGGYLDQDIDRYEVHVEDTTLGRFVPEIEYVHPGGFSGEICVSHLVDDGRWPASVTCPPEGRGRDFCCMPITRETTTINFSIELNISVFDESGTFAIEVRSEGGAPMCADYTVRYRF